jgi:hypothetical protein
MDLYAILPWLVAGIALAVALAYIIYWLKTKKLPPTDEPLVSDNYKIFLDVGSYIIPLEGSVHYFNKIINPKHLHIIAKSLTTDISKLQDSLKEQKTYFYAMRHYTAKLAIICLRYPIETTPHFKSEEKTGKKIVLATGSMGKEISGWKAVVMQPQDQNEHTLNPSDYKILESFGDLLLTIREKAPIQEELDTERGTNKVLQSKVNDMDMEMGALKDEAEYWKRLAMKKEEVTEAGEGLKIPKWIRTLILYGIVALIGYGIGYVLGQSSPDIAQVHPLIFSIGAIVFVWIIKKLFNK